MNDKEVIRLKSTFKNEISEEYEGKKLKELKKIIAKVSESSLDVLINEMMTLVLFKINKQKENDTKSHAIHLKKFLIKDSLDSVEINELLSMVWVFFNKLLIKNVFKMHDDNYNQIMASVIKLFAQEFSWSKFEAAWISLNMMDNLKAILSHETLSYLPSKRFNNSCRIFPQMQVVDYSIEIVISSSFINSLVQPIIIIAFEQKNSNTQRTIFEFSIDQFHRFRYAIAYCLTQMRKIELILSAP